MRRSEAHRPRPRRYGRAAPAHPRGPRGRDGSASAARTPARPASVPRPRAAASRRRRNRRRPPPRPPRRRRDRRSTAIRGACSARSARRYATRTPETRRNLTMGLLSRAGEIIRAKFSSLLNRAENPQETLDYSYERQLQSLQNVKRGVADGVPAKERPEIQTPQHPQKGGKLRTHGRPAVAARRG